MFKLLLALLVGLGIGYSYGYREAASGAPSVMQRTMVKFGVYKVQEDQRRRERATDAITQ